MPELGEVLRLDDNNGEWFVYGHLTYDEAVTSVLAWWHDYEGDWSPRLAPVAWHRHYRWVPAIGDSYMHLNRSDRGCGAMPITEIWLWSLWRDMEEMRAVRVYLRSRCLRMYPGAEIVSIYAFPWRGLRDCQVRFRVPRTGRNTHTWDLGKRCVHLGRETGWRMPRHCYLDLFGGRSV